MAAVAEDSFSFFKQHLFLSSVPTFQRELFWIILGIDYKIANDDCYSFFNIYYLH